VLFFISLIFGNFLVNIAQNLAAYLPGMLAVKVNGYSSNEYFEGVQDRMERTSWAVKFLGLAEDVYINLAFYLILKKWNMIKEHKDRYIFYFFMAMMVFVNFTSALPTVSGRFKQFCNPLIAYFWVNYIPAKSWIYKLVYLIPFVMIVHIYQIYSFHTTYIETPFWFSSPIVTILKYLF
jgi:hypothetical protein